MRFLVDLSDEVMIMHHGELLYRGAPDGLAKDRRVVETYLGEGASARMRSAPASKATTTEHDEPEISVSTNKSDQWSLKVEAAARQLLRQHHSGRIYPIDFLTLERILSERGEADRSSPVARAAQELLQARRDNLPIDQKFEFLSRVFTETQVVRKAMAVPLKEVQKSERANAVELAARNLLERLEKEGRVAPEENELRAALANLNPSPAQINVIGGLANDQ